MKPELPTKNRKGSLQSAQSGLKRPSATLRPAATTLKNIKNSLQNAQRVTKKPKATREHAATSSKKAKIIPRTTSTGSNHVNGDIQSVQSATKKPKVNPQPATTKRRVTGVPNNPWVKSEQKLIFDLVSEHLETNKKMGYKAWKKIANSYNAKMAGVIQDVGEEIVGWFENAGTRKLQCKRTAPVRSHHSIRVIVSRWPDFEDLMSKDRLTRKPASKKKFTKVEKVTKVTKITKAAKVVCVKLGTKTYPGKGLFPDHILDENMVPMALRRISVDDSLDHPYDIFPGLVPFLKK